MTSQAFWAEHQVGGPYETVQESNQALRERAIRYPSLSSHMWHSKYSGKTVLDYGCGPGHDTILFSLHGADITYFDTSPLAMAMTLHRLELHGLPGRPLMKPQLFDHIHCAGVLHHTEHPDAILKTLARQLKPEAHIWLMVYDGELSEHTQSDVPITNWWTTEDVQELAGEAGMNARYLWSYECSAAWRPNCYAACYKLQVPPFSPK